MGKKSISDFEVGLIKNMLDRGLKNNEIQFYFNRQDRPVNSGRITGVRNGTYGSEVPKSTDAELDEFLAGFKIGDVGVKVDKDFEAVPFSPASQARSYFEAQGDTWKVVCGEGADCESKREFDLKKPVHMVRTIAAMANNRGGFLFYGVEDHSQEVVGLVNDKFENTDIARIVDVVRKYMAPTPDFKKFEIEIGALKVGVLFIEPYVVPPIVITKHDDKVAEGDILFRYPGRSERIKPNDLFDLLRRRDLGAATNLLNSAQHIARIGSDRAVILNTDVNKIDLEKKTILIDSKLAEQLKFIKEGSFEEKEGAPTLKLVGDVSLAETVKGETEVVIHEKALEPDMVVLAYLNNDQVGAPIEYIKESAMVQREWLPLFYFAKALENGVADGIAALEGTKANYKNTKKKALARLRGERSAFQKAPTRAKAMLAAIRNGSFNSEVSEEIAMEFTLAVQALPAATASIEELKGVLATILLSVGDDISLRGNVYRAACRLDELEHKVSAS